MAYTPMMLQYLEIKEQYKDSILFYRLGDFYEMFFDDAITASRELELTLTGKNCGEEERAPMCGVPFHSADGYIGRLVKKGYKVAVCEQMEDPALAKGIVKRDIVRIVTPGTVIDNNQLDSEKNNFTVSIYFTESEISCAFADVSTGEISAAVYSGEDRINETLNALSAYEPKEVISNAAIDGVNYPEIYNYLFERLHVFASSGKEHLFDLPKCSELFKKQFGNDLFNDTLERSNLLICSVGSLLSYIAETQLTDINNVVKFSIISSDKYLSLDFNARRNLELCETLRTGEKRGTLLWVLDRTCTAAGARLLRRWIEEPLIDVNEIVKRQQAVNEFVHSFKERNDIIDSLAHFLDLDRLMTRLIYGTANAKDLRAISDTVSNLPTIKEALSSMKSPELSEIYSGFDCLSDIKELIDRAITDEPPFSLREGGFIRAGYNKDVDELSHIVHDAKGFLAELEEKEKELTGIKNLKISHNNVFGYYIEVTKSMLNLVPDRYIRKQTLVGAERFITEELKEKETLISGAYDKLCALEYELFTEIRECINGQLKRVQETASRVAKIDCYISLAEVAIKNSYVCPEVDYGDEIVIKEGRHPVVEKFAKSGLFVPNDTRLDIDRNRFMIITGPNMAGKSTYMRQTALITIMAQIGSFVPASEARIGVVDKIFTRVGASDDLASGTSTFMLEMNEVAYILKNATKRSLVIYDEIGRGTSTFDGMSIARAVAEYTCKKIGCKTMFATHYHELIELENEISGVVNYNIAAKKKSDDIIFLRKIVRGGTDDSYGIEVAKLAGVPQDVIKRAKEILKGLDSEKYAFKPSLEPSVGSNVSIDDINSQEVMDVLSKTDINLLTPMEAMSLLADLINKAK